MSLQQEKLSSISMSNSGGPNDQVHAPRSCCVVESASVLLKQDAHFRGRRLNLIFELNGGVLTVRGSLPSFYLKQKVQAVLKELKGVARIENHVSVISSNGLSSEMRSQGSHFDSIPISPKKDSHVSTH